MSEPELVAQLNDRWRVMLLFDGITWSRRTWRVEQLVDDAWCTHTTLRSADMLRWLIMGEAIGPVEAAAAAVLAALPPRVNVRAAAKAEPVVRAPVARAAPIAFTAPAVMRIPAKPESIQDAAGRERMAIERASVDEERAGAEERYWRGIIK
ncbi:hypothetical protein ACVWZZ_008543 [Bradyrhizobium sp. LM6.10]